MSRWWMLAIAIVVTGGYLLVDRFVKVDDSNYYRRQAEVLYFELPTVHLKESGEPYVLRATDLKGKPFVLNFWATWCKPCKEELPLLTELWKTFEEDGVQVVGVAASDTRDEINSLPSVPPYLLVIDEDGGVGAKYKTMSIPETFLFDENGVLLHHKKGQLTEVDIATYKKMIRSRLGAKG